VKGSCSEVTSDSGLKLSTNFPYNGRAPNRYVTITHQIREHRMTPMRDSHRVRSHAMSNKGASNDVYSAASIK